MQPTNINFGQQPPMEFAGANPQQQQQQFYGQNYYIVQQGYQPQQVQQLQQQNSYQQRGNNFDRNANGGGMPHQDPNGPQLNKNNTLDLKKTKMCPNLKQGQHCPKGDRCNFAHSQEELRMKPNLIKTKMCPNMQKKGGCEFGDNCNFAHSELELRSTPNIYKTSLCNNFMGGECKLGDLCRFAHGEAELRKKVQPMPSNDYNRPMQQFGGRQNFNQQNGGGKGGGMRGGPPRGGRPQGGPPGGNYGQQQQQQQQQVLVQAPQVQPQQAFVDEKGMIVYPNAQPMMINGQQGAYVMTMPGGEGGIQAVQAQYTGGFQGEVGQNSQNHVQAVQVPQGVQQGVQGMPGYAQINPQQVQGGQQVQIVGQQGGMVQQIPQSMPVNMAVNAMK